MLLSLSLLRHLLLFVKFLACTGVDTPAPTAVRWPPSVRPHSDTELGRRKDINDITADKRNAEAF